MCKIRIKWFRSFRSRFDAAEDPSTPLTLLWWPYAAQAANFDLKMEVHGLKDELSRLKKQGARDDSGELERNKALLMKARHAIGKLQVRHPALRVLRPSIAFHRSSLLLAHHVHSFSWLDGTG